MKTSNFQQRIGGTAACIRRQMIATKECGQLTSNDIYFADSWFIGVKIVNKSMVEGV